MKDKSSVLVLCGGKWVGMIIQLRDSMRKIPALRDGMIVVADKSTVTPAGCFAEMSVVVPPISASDYVDRLVEICVSLGVRVVVPLIDLDLERLSPNLRLFEDIGTSVVCPSQSLVDLCMDKRLFEEFVKSEGLPYPTTYQPQDLETASYPLFYKPSRGYGSRNTGMCSFPGEVRRVLSEHSDLILQEYLVGDEVSVDGYISASGKPLVCVPRVRDKVVGGEAYQSHTFESRNAHDLALRTMKALSGRGLRGPLNIQMFLTKQGPYLIEVNTRLGSGSVLSNVASGGRLFGSVLMEACGVVCDGDPHEYQSDVTLYRFLGDVFHTGPDVVKVVPGGGCRE